MRPWAPTFKFNAKQLSCLLLLISKPLLLVPLTVEEVMVTWPNPVKINEGLVWMAFVNHATQQRCKNDHFFSRTRTILSRPYLSLLDEVGRSPASFFSSIKGLMVWSPESLLFFLEISLSKLIQWHLFRNQLVAKHQSLVSATIEFMLTLSPTSAQNSRIILPTGELPQRRRPASGLKSPLPGFLMLPECHCSQNVIRALQVNREEERMKQYPFFF